MGEAEDAIDVAKKLRCIELASQAHTLQYMANELGVSRQVVDWVRTTDGEFNAALTYALREAAGDHYESNLKKQSDNGNVTATIVGLKLKKRYVEVSEKHNVNVNVNGDKMAAMTLKWEDLSKEDQTEVREAQDTIRRLLGG